MSERVVVYGADWCGDTRRTLRHLDQKKIQYDYIDIDQDTDAEAKVIEFNKGKRRIPLVEIASETETKSLSVPDVDAKRFATILPETETSSVSVSLWKVSTSGRPSTKR